MTPPCTCTEITRRLLVSLLHVEEGDVHEAGCRDRAFESGVDQGHASALALMRATFPALAAGANFEAALARLRVAVQEGKP